MAGANSTIQVSNLDFNSIKSNFITYLQGQDTFKDYNFEGSSMSILLDLMAYNTQYNAYYLNMVANEMFLDSAIQRSSVVSQAKLLNYTPKSSICPSAIVDVNFTGVTTTQLFQLEIHNLNSVVRDYKFSSKIFPEMGSIIAISAQDATGIGKLGYDNATLVAWNEGISDRLIPKKDFNSSIALNDPNKPNIPATFLLPFLTKIYNYFQYINNQSVIDDFNYAYGGLDFAYKDFLSNLDRFDPQNRFKTIIPTELSITLDGLGGIIIGNLFKINQDIVPKGYKNTGGRNVAYIVTRLGHQISGND